MSEFSILDFILNLPVNITSILESNAIAASNTYVPAAITTELMIQLLEEHLILWDLIDLLSQSSETHYSNILTIYANCQEMFPTNYLFNTNKFKAALIAQIADYVLFHIKLGQIDLSIVHYLNNFLK